MIRIPAREVSGGVWYDDGEFNEGWIEALRSSCREFLVSQAGCQVHLDDFQEHFLQKKAPRT